jgi:hypothetical protein
MRLIGFLIKAIYWPILAIGGLALIVGGLAVGMIALENGHVGNWIFSAIFLIAGTTQFFGSFALFSKNSVDTEETAD